MNIVMEMEYIIMNQNDMIIMTYQLKCKKTPFYQLINNLPNDLKILRFKII